MQMITILCGAVLCAGAISVRRVSLVDNSILRLCENESRRRTLYDDKQYLLLWCSWLFFCLHFCSFLFASRQSCL